MCTLPEVGGRVVENQLEAMSLLMNGVCISSKIARHDATDFAFGRVAFESKSMRLLQI